MVSTTVRSTLQRVGGTPTCTVSDSTCIRAMREGEGGDWGAGESGQNKACKYDLYLFLTSFQTMGIFVRDCLLFTFLL